MNPTDAAETSPPLPVSRRACWRVVIGILLGAAVWRAVVAVFIPCIAKDSVTFCWYARDLGQQGLAYLRLPGTAQHPLFPATVLAVQRIARLAGAPDTPLTWQGSGQAVCLLSGMVVVALAGALTVRLVRRLRLPVDERLAGCCGLLLTALLPLNVWLSAEVMSDELHLVFYLIGAFALLKLDSVKAALVCGLAGGLAFLTRPEGAVIAVAGVIVLAVERQVSWRVRGGRAVVLAAGFLVCAAPFWAAVGKLSPKKNPADWFERDEASSGAMTGSWCRMDAPASDADGGEMDVALAKLTHLDLGWYALVPYALYKLFVAGRVVVPLLALLPLVNLRRRLLRPPLAGLTVCAVAHLGLVITLLHQYRYLESRHLLVLVMLLVPLAATLLARLIELGRQRRSLALVGAALAFVVVPLGFYALRAPNTADRCTVDAARWLTEHDPHVRGKRLIGGSSTKRIAFYADMRWEQWYEQPEYYAALCKQLLAGGPGYFAIMLEPSSEAAKPTEATGNRALLEELLSDPRMKGVLKPVHMEPGAKKSELHVLELTADGR
jgi:hypothetical protein